MEKSELKALIKESTREILRAERLLLCQLLAPVISDAEQLEIDAEFGTPSDYETDKLIDMTGWVLRGGKIPES